MSIQILISKIIIYMFTYNLQTSWKLLSLKHRTYFLWQCYKQTPSRYYNNIWTSVFFDKKPPYLDWFNYLLTSLHYHFNICFFKISCTIFQLRTYKEPSQSIHNLIAAFDVNVCNIKSRILILFSSCDFTIYLYNELHLNIPNIVLCS